MVSGVQEGAWGGVVNRVFLALMLVASSQAACNDLPLAFGLASGSTNLQIRLRALQHTSRVRGRGVHCECSCMYLCVLCVAVYLYDPGILFCIYTYNSMCKCPHNLDFRTRQRGATALCGTQLRALTDGPDAGAWGGYD